MAHTTTMKRATSAAVLTVAMTLITRAVAVTMFMALSIMASMNRGRDAAVAKAMANPATKAAAAAAQSARWRASNDQEPGHR